MHLVRQGLENECQTECGTTSLSFYSILSFMKGCVCVCKQQTGYGGHALGLCTAFILAQEERARLEREAEALEMKRMQVLERLAASVPYADACANAEAKLDHITGDATPGV